MVVFSPVAQQPSSGIEDRLQAIQEILRRADQQTVIAIDLWCDEGYNCRSRSLERHRFDAAFQKTKLAEAVTDGSSHVDFHRQISKLWYTLFSKRKDPPKVKNQPLTDHSAIQRVNWARPQVLVLWRAAEQNNWYFHFWMDIREQHSSSCSWQHRCDSQHITTSGTTACVYQLRRHVPEALAFLVQLDYRVYQYCKYI